MSFQCRAAKRARHPPMPTPYKLTYLKPTMPDVYTFVTAGPFSRSAHVYRGSFTSSSQTSRMQPAYEANISHSHSDISVKSVASARTIIAGHYKGFTRRRAVVHWSNKAAQLERTDPFFEGWTIHDFQGRRYTWKVGFTKVKVIAVFDRAMLNMILIGRLSILQPVSEEFLAIIILSTRIVHISIK
ncbi:hypothetical protein DL89DRAFT_268634 [Linderina pennispora]|uniref:Uncharacterized protein n=1 Tax=Linderina pennispora TaxID=61395 RepID=A0A1Y1W400_9FUNG|nr:uncharacterized protein DL89DRAFT_268634 [Linderina pennispora]ORX68102.1 hypothetical protein DL89DRAFT_268634 [Linderina pennispora]